MTALRSVVVAGVLALAAPAGAIDLQPVVEGLTAPVDLVDPQDGTGRLFAVEQHGLVQVPGADGTLREPLLLDLRPHMLGLRDGSEGRGPLGSAVLTDDTFGPFGSTGKVLKLVP